MPLLTKRIQTVRRKVGFPRTGLKTLRKLSLHAWKCMVSCLMVVVPDENFPYHPSVYKGLENQEASYIETLRELDLVVSELEKENQLLSKKILAMLSEITPILSHANGQMQYLETHAFELGNTAFMAFGS